MPPPTPRSAHPRTSGRRPALRTCAVLAALGAVSTLATSGCHRLDQSPPAALALDIEDLLFGPKEPIAGASPPAIAWCGEESHYAVALAEGERLTLQREIEGPTTLEVGACAAGGRLRLSLEVGQAWGSQREIALGPTWSSHQLPLAGDPPGRVTLTLSAAGTGGRPIYLRDLALRAERSAPPPAPVPRAILISLDALREDAIGALSRPGSGLHTPHLDRFATEAERFFPHWAAEISTKPSHATMLTGLPSRVHGCDRGERPLPDEVLTLAERLRSSRVATAAMMSLAPFFHPRYGLDQGFDHYQLAAWSTSQELRASRVWLSAHRERPSFLFLHLYAAHSDQIHLPYEAPGSSSDLVARHFGIADYGCRGGSCASKLLHRLNYDTAFEPLPREAEALRFLYDRGVEALDAELGQFFDDLRRSGLWEDTLVIVTADHGEQFGEHGFFLHVTAHEETLRVPLLVKWPGGARAGTVTERPSTAVDLAPTLLDHFGLPASDLTGSSLARPPRRQAPIMVSHDAVRIGTLKLLLPTTEQPEALFDLATDPEERRDLLAQRPTEAAKLRLAWNRVLRRAALLAEHPRPAAQQPFTDVEREGLRALGYLR